MTGEPARPPRSRRRKLLLAAIVWAGALATLEGATRVRERIVYGSFSRAGAGIYQVSSGQLAVKPNVDTGGSRLRIATNSLGFRSPEVAVPKPAGTFRIVCVGGSTTFEVYADANEDTWPALLERRLKTRHPRVEVVNAGVAGFTLEHILHPGHWEKVARLEPDLVHHFHATNDVGTFAHAHLGARTASASSQALGRGAKALTDWSLAAYKVWMLAEAYVVPEDDGDTDRYPDEGVRRYEERLRELVRRTRALGARPALATSVLRWRRDQPLEERRALARGAPHAYHRLSLKGIDDAFARHDELTERVARETGALLVPAARELSGRPELYGDIMHFRKAGSEAMAELVAKTLEAAGLP